MIRLAGSQGGPHSALTLYRDIKPYKEQPVPRSDAIIEPVNQPLPRRFSGNSGGVSRL